MYSFSCINNEYTYIMRQPGIEPGSSAWEANILPLNYWRMLSRTFYVPKVYETENLYFLYIFLSHNVFKYFNFSLFMGKDKKTEEKKQERRLHYNVVDELAPENVFSWYFLIINKSQEIDRIKQGICDELKSIEDPSIIREGVVGNSHGLKYSFFNLQSPRSKIELCQIYNGNIIKDRRLYSKNGSDFNLLSVLEYEGIVPTYPRRQEFIPKDDLGSSGGESIDYTI